MVRVESDAIYFNGPTETAGGFYWVPGAFASFSKGQNSDAGPISLVATNTPGETFLANFPVAKCIAACLQVSYPGSELTRAGICSYGVVPAGTLTQFIPAANGGAAGNTTAANIRTLSQEAFRTPDGGMEIRWRPGSGDDDFIDLAALAVTGGNMPEMARGKNAIIFSVGGIPVSTGIRLRRVAVYEVSPTVGSGLMSSVETTRSHNTTTQVVQALDDKKPGWWKGPVGDVLFHATHVGGVAAAAFYGGPKAAQAAQLAFVGANALRNM